MSSRPCISRLWVLVLCYAMLAYPESSLIMLLWHTLLCLHGKGFTGSLGNQWESLVHFYIHFAFTWTINLIKFRTSGAHITWCSSQMYLSATACTISLSHYRDSDVVVSLTSPWWQHNNMQDSCGKSYWLPCTRWWCLHCGYLTDWGLDYPGDATMGSNILLLCLACEL